MGSLGCQAHSTLSLTIITERIQVSDSIWIETGTRLKLICTLLLLAFLRAMLQPWLNSIRKTLRLNPCSTSITYRYQIKRIKSALRLCLEHLHSSIKITPLSFAELCSNWMMMNLLNLGLFFWRRSMELRVENWISYILGDLKVQMTMMSANLCSTIRAHNSCRCSLMPNHHLCKRNAI